MTPNPEWIAEHKGSYEQFSLPTEEDGVREWVRIGGDGSQISVAFIMAERDLRKREAVSGAEAVEVALRNGVVPCDTHSAEMDAEDALALAADLTYHRLGDDRRYKALRWVEHRLEQLQEDAA